MHIELTAEQIEQQVGFRTFVEEYVIPYAELHDQQQQTPPELIQHLAQQGYLGATVPKEYGGSDMEAITFGLLCEQIGRASASLLSLLTVHGMVCQAIIRWGSAEQKQQWLPKLATGEIIGGFGLTEPNIGSDAKSVETTAIAHEENYQLTGHKKWISFGQVADLFLIIAQCDNKPTAFLVERKTAGFSTKPINNLLGFRSAMLAELILDNCLIPAQNLVGRIGFGFSHIAGTALDYGRYCIAWGCVGLAQACLEASLHYTKDRKQFGTFLSNHQLIQQIIADMITQIKAARLLCYQAGYLKNTGDPALIMETSIAKYFASQMVSRVADNAVQVHGANGCSDEYPVQRYLRDAKIMEIIEGSSQMQQIIIAKYGYQTFLRETRKNR